MFNVSTMLHLVMWPLVGLGAVVVIVTILAVLLKKGGDGEEGEAVKEKTLYQYSAKKSLMTSAERDFYNALGQAVGTEFRIFAQVYLSALLDEKIQGQNWKAARAHIDRKSVDFVLCDKDFVETKLAIELDDRSHEREDRIERDGIVEGILKQAGVPLLRILNNGGYDVADIAMKVRAALAGK